MGHRDPQKVWPVLAPTAMHQCCLPRPYHPPERTGPTTCAGVGQHARVRQSTAAKKEGGSLIRGTEKSDRLAALASAETQVRARAVLPGSGSSEHQATGALPQSADNTGSAGHHLVERRQETRRGHRSHMKSRSVEGLFQQPRDVTSIEQQSTHLETASGINNRAERLATRVSHWYSRFGIRLRSAICPSARKPNISSSASLPLLRR
jgi:hypothetical protein